MDRLNLKISVIIIIAVFLVVCMAVLSHQKITTNNEKILGTKTEPYKQEFELWKSDFDIKSQKTYIDCLTTKDTFRKLYCNLEYQKGYNQSYIFS